MSWGCSGIGIGIGISVGHIAAGIVCRVVVAVTVGLVRRLRGIGVGRIEKVGTSRLVLLEKSHFAGFFKGWILSTDADIIRRLYAFLVMK